MSHILAPVTANFDMLYPSPIRPVLNTYAESISAVDFDAHALKKKTTTTLAMHDPSDIRIINALPFSNAANCSESSE
jgi:hypothetical protein